MRTLLATATCLLPVVALSVLIVLASTSREAAILIPAVVHYEPDRSLLLGAPTALAGPSPLGAPTSQPSFRLGYRARHQDGEAKAPSPRPSPRPTARPAAVARPAVKVPRRVVRPSGSGMARAVADSWRTSGTASGTASHMGNSQGPRYLALPIGPGYRVRISGAGGSVVMVSTDAGPSLQMQRQGRVADLSRATFEFVCGLPASAGLCPVSISVLGR